MGADEKLPNQSALWYRVVVDASLRQGDLFRNVTAYWVKEPTGDGGEADVGAVTGDFIVASASCDVDQKGYEFVLLHRVFPANDSTLSLSGDELLKAIEVMRRGLHPTRFLLSSSDAVTPALPLSFATSKQHALVSISYLRAQCVGPRLRLRSPIRESYGSWVAACFGRVGIETEAQIPRASKILYPGQVLKHTDE